MEIPSDPNAKKKTKRLKIQISHFYWSFSNDIMAVKWLMPLLLFLWLLSAQYSTVQHSAIQLNATQYKTTLLTVSVHK